MLEDRGELSSFRPLTVLKAHTMGSAGYSTSVWPREWPSLGSGVGARVSERDLRDESPIRQGTL
jgi:hypothetical protein